MKYMIRRLICLMLVLANLNAVALAEPTLAVRTAVFGAEEARSATLPSADPESVFTLTKKSGWKSRVVAMKWYDGGSSVLRKGEYGALYDIETGMRLKIKRMGGSSHADVEPASKSDTAKLKKMGYSWDRRPGILYSDGKFVACSFATQPHGDQTLSKNGYHGQFCLHMVGSKTHGSDHVDADHQAAIKKAYSWAH